MALLCVLPLLNLFAISLSGKAAANSGMVTFWPVDFTTMAYEKTFQNANFIRSIAISVARTLIGTFFSMFVIVTAGYALSKDFRGRTALMWFFVFTMLFGGGLIPSYLVNSALGLKNSFWVYIIPGAFSCYNLILIMNFFKSIPKALEEAALVDGANFFQILWKIFLPLSKAGLATVALFNVVGRWNDWFTGMLYVENPNLIPLQTLLTKLQNSVEYLKKNSAVLNTPDGLQLARSAPSISLRMACTVAVILPMLFAYPFFQRFFVNGLTVGSIKE